MRIYDVTIVAWSIGMTYAIKAADELAKEGIEAEIIDLRTIRPMDTGNRALGAKDAAASRWKRAGRNPASVPRSRQE